MGAIIPKATAKSHQYILQKSIYIISTFLTFSRVSLLISLYNMYTKNKTSKPSMYPIFVALLTCSFSFGCENYMAHQQLVPLVYAMESHADLP